MSNNIDNDKRKLVLKAELLRHLDTAARMHEEGKPSSVIKAITIAMDLDALLVNGIEPNLKKWEKILAE